MGLNLIYYIEQTSHLLVKIGFFNRINVALKRGQIDSELFSLGITECDLRNNQNIVSRHKRTEVYAYNKHRIKFKIVILVFPSMLFITHFAFDLDLCVSQPSCYFLHEC